MEITHQKNNCTISQKHNNDLNTPNNTLSEEIVVVVSSKSKKERTPSNSTKIDSHSYQGGSYNSCSIRNRNNEKLASAWSSDPTIIDSCGSSSLLLSLKNNESEEEKQYLNAVDERCLLHLYTKQADRTLSSYRENLYHQTGSLVSNKAIGPYIAEIEKRLHRNKKKSLSDSCVFRSNTISTIGDNHDDDDDSCESSNSENNNNANNNHHHHKKAQNTSGNENDGPGLEEKSTKRTKKVNAVVRWLNKIRDHRHHKKRYSFPTATTITTTTTTSREAQSATFNTTT